MSTEEQKGGFEFRSLRKVTKRELDEAIGRMDDRERDFIVDKLAELEREEDREKFRAMVVKLKLYTSETSFFSSVAALSIVEWYRSSQPPVPRPPRRLEKLVSVFCPPGKIDEILGDLEERFIKIAARDGAAEAGRWYQLQAVRIVFYRLGQVAVWATDRAANLAQLFFRLGG